jgi:hypothetical protein
MEHIDRRQAMTRISAESPAEAGGAPASRTIRQVERANVSSIELSWIVEA